MAKRTDTNKHVYFNFKITGKCSEYDSEPTILVLAEFCSQVERHMLIIQILVIVLFLQVWLARYISFVRKAFKKAFIQISSSTTLHVWPVRLLCCVVVWALDLSTSSLHETDDMLVQFQRGIEPGTLPKAANFMAGVSSSHDVANAVRPRTISPGKTRSRSNTKAMEPDYFKPWGVGVSHGMHYISPPLQESA